jgi:hypothetical protein
VIREDAARSLGTGVLEMLNRGKLPIPKTGNALKEVFQKISEIVEELARSFSRPFSRPSLSLADGGYVPGGVHDALDTELHGGEFVLNSAAVSSLGVSTLNQVNAGGALPGGATVAVQAIAGVQQGQAKMTDTLAEMKEELSGLGEQVGQSLKEILGTGETVVQIQTTLAEKILADAIYELSKSGTLKIHASAIVGG